MKTSNKRVLLAVAAAITLVGCATAFSGVQTLRGSSAETADQQAGEGKAYAGKRPGSGGQAVLIARNYEQQPPLVPHAIDNFDEITTEDNQCMDCHAPAKARAKNAPRVGDSHLLAPGAEDLRMNRYQCNSCHVPQVDAPPLVRNTFQKR